MNSSERRSARCSRLSKRRRKRSSITLRIELAAWARADTPLRGENALRDQTMDVGVPIRAEGTKGLNRRHRAGSDVFTIEKFLETLVDGFEGCLGDKAEQGTFSFKQTTKRFRNAESKVPVG